MLAYTYIEKRFDVCLDVAKKYNDPNKTSCTRSSILSAISFPPSETVQVHEPCASRHGYLYSICGKREGGVGGEKKRKGLVGIKVYSFLSLIAKDFLNLFYLLFDVENVEHFRSICERIFVDIMLK